MNKKIFAASLLSVVCVLMGAGCSQSESGTTNNGAQVKISTEGPSNEIEIKANTANVQTEPAVNTATKVSSSTNVNIKTTNQGGDKGTKAQVNTQTDDTKVDISSEGKVKVQAPGVDVNIGAF